MRKWVAEVATMQLRNALANFPESRYVSIVLGFRNGRELTDDDCDWLNKHSSPMNFRIYRSPGALGKAGLEMRFDLGAAIFMLATYLADSDGRVHLIDCENCGQPFLAARRNASICYSCPRDVYKDRPRRG